MNIIIQNAQKAECFSMMFQHIRLFTEHVNVTFNKENMYLQSMDSARVSIFEINLPSTWFDTYEHTNETPITIGISSSLLFKILNTRDKAQRAELHFSPDNEDKLFINFTCENKAIFDRHFELPLIDLECELMEIPDIESQADLCLSSANFANIVNQLQLFGDTLEIECTEEKISFHSISQDCGKMLVNIDIDELNSYSISENENMRLSFSLKMLHNICMYSKISKDVDIHLTNNYPMKVVYHLGDDDSKMTFYLAPKISDE